MALKPIINGFVRNFGYQFVRVSKLDKLKGKQLSSSKQDRFHLTSGERQIATDIEGIRRDHIVRYEMVGHFLKSKFDNTKELLGGDIFCGNGYGSYLINQQTNCYTFGVDASQEAIELANTHYANSKMFFSVKRFPFELPENIFDFIVSFETIEHLVDDIKLVESFSKSLKDDGYLFLSAPNEEICSFDKNNYEFHVKHYTFSQLVNLIKNKGNFELITWYGNGAYNFNEGVFVSHREESEMELKENNYDSHLTFVFKKVKS